MNPFAYFDMVYYINLSKRKDRKESVLKQFQRINLKPQRFNAIEREIGWHGARDSHLELIKQARRNGYKRILVFEDDIEILETDLNYYQELFAEIEATGNWHLLYLSANTHCPLQKSSKLLYTAEYCLGLHSVAYNKYVYDLILSEKETGIIDLFYQDKILPYGRSYVADRICTTQINDYSDIDKKFVNQEYILNRFRRHCRG